MATNGNGVIFLDRNGMLLFVSSLGRVLQFNFAPNVIRDLEVINHEMLEAQIDAFFKQSGIAPFEGTILLSSNLLFEKPISPEQTDEEKTSLEAFIENLPFEHVGSITYTNDQPRYIATNKDFYQTLIKIFKKNNCVIDLVLPASLVETDVTQMTQLTPQESSRIMRAAQSLKQFSFLINTPQKVTQTAVAKPETQSGQTVQSDSQVPPPPKPDGESKQRLFVLIGVFGVLLLILGVVAFTML